ncbi:MAG TPA: hypothetical protein VIZ29_09345 [Gaiellaceae bacterium]
MSDTSLLGRLAEDLRRGGCVPSEAGEGALDVIQPDARDAREARLELTFYLRAWQSRHPEVELRFA